MRKQEDMQQMRLHILRAQITPKKLGKQNRRWIDALTHSLEMSVVGDRDDSGSGYNIKRLIQGEELEFEVPWTNDRVPNDAALLPAGYRLEEKGGKRRYGYA